MRMRRTKFKPDRYKLLVLCSIAEVLIKELVDTVPSAKLLIMDKLRCQNYRLVEVLINQPPLSIDSPFDPEHRFDLCFVLDDGCELVALPIEVKAGLQSPRIKERMAAMFGLGNMLAILDGQTRIKDLTELRVRHQATEIRLNGAWGLIARRSVLNNLRRNKKFKSTPLEISLEDILNCVSNEELAVLVNRILASSDYRADWHLH